AAVQLVRIFLRGATREVQVALPVQPHGEDYRGRRFVELDDALAEHRVAWQRIERAARVVALALRPRDHVGIADVFQRAVRIADHRAEERVLRVAWRKWRGRGLRVSAEGENGCESDKRAHKSF